MQSEKDEETLLRSVALQNAQSILLARQRAEQEVIQAKEALELKTAELAHSLAMMRATLESTTDGILVTDGGGEVTGFNEKFVEMWRVPHELMESRDHRRVTEVTSRQFTDPRQFLARIEAVYAASPPESYDLLELSDGKVFERFSRIQFVDDRNVGRVWSYRDITERQRAEDALREAKQEAEQANNAKTQFLAVLSHELRTPLNPILLAVTAMLERPEEPEELPATLEMIRHYVNLQARLIDDLLDVMRIVRGKMPLHWEVADGHRLIDQAIQVCRSEILGKELRTEVDLAATEYHVNADPARLQQVFWNLIKNAVKFTPAGGTITIRTRNEEDGSAPEGRLVIEIGDDGIGIEPEVLPTIFDPFQQGETTITRTYGGLGLGLAICRGIIEAHAGTLVAKSAGKHQGSTFRVVLTALPSSAAEAEGEPDARVGEPEAPRPSSLRILVVEDEPATLRLMARLLRGLGYGVMTAGSIAATMEALETGKFDLIISDIGLPDGTGLALMQRVISRHGPVPAIALTGYGMEEDIRRSQHAGFTAHLTKPIDFVKLEAMIRQVTH